MKESFKLFIYYFPSARSEQNFCLGLAKLELLIVNLMGQSDVQ